MADLRWDDHAGWLLDPADDEGCLPDLSIADTTVADWQAFLDLVEERGWPYDYVVGCFEMPLPRAETVLSRPPGVVCPILSVRPGSEVGVVFRFHRAERIDFDVYLDQLQGQEGLDVLCGFLAAIGRRLGTSVPTYPEGGCTGKPFLGFDVAADRVRVWTPPDE
ncbi:hypothetical protein [Kitasatospora sp. SUK 42]|uniref:hypothetical protein n=1 Tax=Kitasatospora sp. SUK 42 TaxID=1588882 RepID=UPI0018CA555B|nr:hypothetical protein [Kitasatospora sp. SUK 42]MBV2153136.1 hypothetical protein [Kitasatospora sp. SUK 42]